MGSIESSLKTIALGLVGFILLYAAFKAGFYIGCFITSNQIKTSLEKQKKKKDSFKFDKNHHQNTINT